MKTLLLIALVIIGLVLAGLAFDVRLSAGPYDPESVAAGEVIREMAPRATAQALDHARIMAAIKEQEAAESAALATQQRRKLAGIATIAAGCAAGLIVGALAGLLAWLLVNVTKRAKTPPAMVLNNLVIIRSPRGDIRLIDSVTGAAWGLLADRLPDSTRADSITRIELARLLAEHNPQAGRIEAIPAAIPQQQEVLEHGQK